MNALSADFQSCIELHPLFEYVGLFNLYCLKTISKTLSQRFDNQIAMWYIHNYRQLTLTAEKMYLLNCINQRSRNDNTDDIDSKFFRLFKYACQFVIEGPPHPGFSYYLFTNLSQIIDKLTHLSQINGAQFTYPWKMIERLRGYYYSSRDEFFQICVTYFASSSMDNASFHKILDLCDDTWNYASCCAFEIVTKIAIMTLRVEYICFFCIFNWFCTPIA